MEDIRIIQKPDNVSYDDIHELLTLAHKKNYEKGMVLNYSRMSGEEIQKKLGKEGRTWVAMDGDKLVGTTSVTYFQGKSWWNHGKKVAHGCFTGILKEYQGIGLMEELNAKKYDYIRNMGVDMTEGDTAETNYTVLKVFGKDGYKMVSYYAPNPNHFSVRIAKWLNGCPYSDQYIERRYKIAKMLTHWQYKPGKVERARIVTFFCKILNTIIRYK